MNERWFGDSYDIVKRFFVGVVTANGYTVYADPMFTGRGERAFLRFIQAATHADGASLKNSALFMDPDTGVSVHDGASKRHTNVTALVEKLSEHDLVFVFDQAFSRALPARPQLFRKLRKLQALGAHAFYYDSHARFLFCTRTLARLTSLRRAIVKTGLPENRVVSLGAAGE